MSAVPSCPLRYFWVKFHLIFFTNFECSFTWCHINAESSNRPLEIYFSVMQKRLIFLKLLFARGLIRVMRMTFEFSNQNRLKELKWRWRLVWDELSINWHKKRMQQLKIYRLKIKSTFKYNSTFLYSFSRPVLHLKSQYEIFQRNELVFRARWTTTCVRTAGQQLMVHRESVCWALMDDSTCEWLWGFSWNWISGHQRFIYAWTIIMCKIYNISYFHYITLFRVPFAKVLLLSKTECHIPRHYLKIFIRK